MIHIVVEDYWGMRVGFRVIPGDPVRTLKQMIEETDGKLVGVYLLYARTLQLVIRTGSSGAKA